MATRVVPRKVKNYTSLDIFPEAFFYITTHKTERCLINKKEEKERG